MDDHRAPILLDIERGKERIDSSFSQKVTMVIIVHVSKLGKKEWARPDSNRRPLGYQPSAPPG